MSTIIDPEELMQEAKLSFDKGDIESGADAYRDAASVYADHGNYQLAGFALASLALRLSPNPASLDKALSAYESAAKAFQRAGQPRQAADALFSAGILAKTGNQSRLATKLLLEVVAEYERLSAGESSAIAPDEVPELRALAGEARKCVGEIFALAAAESGSIHAK